MFDFRVSGFRALGLEVLGLIGYQGLGFKVVMA